MKHNTIQCNAIQCNVIQCDAMQCNIQYNTIQYNTIQYNTIQYNTIQYNTILYFNSAQSFDRPILWSCVCFPSCLNNRWKLLYFFWLKKLNSWRDLQWIPGSRFPVWVSLRMEQSTASGTAIVDRKPHGDLGCVSGTNYWPTFHVGGQMENKANPANKELPTRIWNGYSLLLNLYPCITKVVKNEPNDYFSV